MAKAKKTEEIEEKAPGKKNVKIGKNQHRKLKIKAVLDDTTVEEVINNLIDENIKVEGID